jgi:hypothetical protein
VIARAASAGRAVQRSRCSQYRHARAGGQLGGVDVAVDPERGLSVSAPVAAFVRRPPQVAPLVAAADGLEAQDVGARLDGAAQQRREFVVPVEAAEVGRRKGGRHGAVELGPILTARRRPRRRPPRRARRRGGPRLRES